MNHLNIKKEHNDNKSINSRLGMLFFGKNTKNKIALKLVLTLAATLGLVNTSYASCAQSTIQNGSGSQAWGMFFPPSTITISSANKAVGTVLWTQQVETSPISVVTCTSTSTDALMPEGKGVDTGQNYKSNYSIYTTSVPGIGYTVSYDAGGPSFSNSSGKGFPAPNFTTGTEFTTEGTLVSMAYIVTGPITSGVITSGSPVASDKFGGITQVSWMSANDVTIKASGCEVSGNSNISVNLGTIGTSKFPKKGSVENNTPFAISLSCSAGTKVNLTISGDADTTQTGTILNTGTAKGLGVQILQSNNVPVTLGTSFLAITSAQTSDEIALSGQMIRTGKVKAGTINASATYTLNYQ